MASCLYGRYTRTCIQLTDSTPTRSSKSFNVGERGTTVNWRLTFTAPPSAVCHRVVGVHYVQPGTTEQVSHRRGGTGAVVLATKIRLEIGNDHRREKKKAMTAVRSKRKLLRWKEETEEIRNRCNILG